jgi:ribonuclease P protein component
MCAQRPKPFGFPKTERLTGQKKIEELFQHGSSFFLYPYRVKYLAKDELAAPQVLIAVPKKKLRKAVDRNLVKRRTREAYRLHKALLKPSQSIYVAFIYQAQEVLPFDSLESQMKKGLQKLSHLLSL